MKRRSLYVLILVVFGVAAALGYMVARTASSQRTSEAPASASSPTVRLYTDRAEPDTLAVAVNTQVSFASADTSSHSLSLGGGTHGLGEGSAGDGHTHQHLGDFSSGAFESDEAWIATFHKPGTYILHDHLHPSVQVTIIAYQPEE